MPPFIATIARPGNIATVLAGIIAITALFSASVASLKFNWSIVRMAEYVAPLTDDELAVSLMRVGLTPEACCAAGLTTDQTISLVANAREHLQTNIATLRLADEQYVSAKSTHDQLKRLVQAGKASDEDRANFSVAVTTLTTTTAARDSALNTLYNAAVDGLADASTVKLGNCKDSIHWSACPVQYRVESRSEADWIALRDALANIRISADLQDDANHDCMELVNEAKADPDVAAATTAIELKLNGINNAWNNAVYQQD